MSLGHSSDNLTSLLNRWYEPVLRNIEGTLSRIQPSANCRKFVVNRMGSTGSSWLAKLLNSHPDVFCRHEGVVYRIHPAREYGPDEILRYLEALGAETAHGAYRAIGDVGSVWAAHVACLPSFTTAVLVRHPGRLLFTRLTAFPYDQSFAHIPQQSRQILWDVWKLDLQAYEPLDQIFLHDIVTFVSQVWVIDKVDLVLRIEDLQQVEKCQNSVHALTGMRFPRRLIQNALRSRVNQRVRAVQPIAEIVAKFSKRQRDWYAELLADAAPIFGYNLWNDDLPSEPLPNGLKRGHSPVFAGVPAL